MKSELQKFYPEITKVEVVHLASLNLFQDIPICVSNFAKYDFLNDKPFIICSAHICFHKNIGNIIAAASILNKEFVRVRFVFTGGSTEILSGRSAYLGLDTEYNGEFDIFGLGYIPDIDMDFLLKKAFAVLNASFYEAGNGIGFDAWPLGIPVIQSNIPSFQEHLDLQGFKAFTFDPRNPHDLVESILKCLENETLRNEYINASLIASKNLSWDITAEKYLSIFEKTLKN
jgi:glycosyltransferase involved in cell wall biosynthesis